MRKSLVKKGFWLVFIMTIVSLSTFAQTAKVSGKIIDEKNQALVGVSVVVKGTTKGTVSDAEGNYSIEADGGQTLSFSFVGYTSKEVAINNQSTVNVSLAEDAAALDEVVVTGVFDKRTRMESSVAISTLSTKQLDRIVPSSGIDLLKNLPGVYVNSSKGEVSGALYTRGLSIGDGFFYVSMQEDGLPILAQQGSSTTNPNFKPDGFLRADASINRVEAVRGGTASILSANALVESSIMFLKRVDKHFKEKQEHALVWKVMGKIHCIELI